MKKPSPRRRKTNNSYSEHQDHVSYLLVLPSGLQHTNAENRQEELSCVHTCRVLISLASQRQGGVLEWKDAGSSGGMGRWDQEGVLPSLSVTSWSVWSSTWDRWGTKQELMGGEGLGNQIIIKVSGYQQLLGLSERNFTRYKAEMLVSDPDADLHADKLRWLLLDISWELLHFWAGSIKVILSFYYILLLADNHYYETQEELNRNKYNIPVVSCNINFRIQHFEVSWVGSRSSLLGRFVLWLI